MNHFSFRSNQDVDVVRVVLAAGEVLIEAHLVAQLGADNKALKDFLVVDPVFCVVVDAEGLEREGLVAVPAAKPRNLTKAFGLLGIRSQIALSIQSIQEFEAARIQDKVSSTSFEAVLAVYLPPLFPIFLIDLGGYMLTHAGWGPETPIEEREFYYSLVRRLRREGGAQQLIDMADKRAAQFVRIFGGPAALEFPEGGRVIVSTCNRLEVYQGAGKPEWDTARHLFELASGLRSPLLGENAILGQVRRAYEEAVARQSEYEQLGQPQNTGQRALATAGLEDRECIDCRVRAGWAEQPEPAPRLPSTENSSGAGSSQSEQSEQSMNWRLSPELHSLFQAALACGKEVRSSTTISQGAVGHAAAVCQLLRQRGAIAGARVLLIGANKLNESILSWLGQQDAGDICIINRDTAKARKMAELVRCRSASFADLPQELPAADVLISATSAPHFTIHPELHSAKPGALWFDLAVPRDINPAFQGSVELFNISDIEAAVSQAIAGRHTQLPQAQAIVDAALERYFAREQRRTDFAARLAGSA